MNYSKAIRTIRSTKGISQKELAVLASIDPSYISRIEKGERVPTLDIIEKIATVLNVPVYLLTLLASEKEDLHGLPEKETGEIATSLLNLLLKSSK